MSLDPLRYRAALLTPEGRVPRGEGWFILNLVRDDVEDGWLRHFVLLQLPDESSGVRRSASCDGGQSAGAVHPRAQDDPALA
jgi:hypothetical protein